MNLMDLLAANQQPGGPAGMVDRGQDPGGIAAFLPQAQSAQPPAHKRGLFGSGISGWGFLGALGDALQGAAGKEGTFGPMVARQRDLRQQNQNAMDRFIAEQQWKAAHPDVPTEQQNWDAYINAPPDRKAEIEKYRTMSAPRFVTDPATGAQGYAPTMAPSAGPPAGYVWQGRRFKGGGDYRDPNNWEDVGGSTVPPSTGFPGSR